MSQVQPCPGDWDARVFNLVMGAYIAGIRHSAAYEHLRRSGIGEVTACRTCWSVGTTRDGEVCRASGGTGIVALRA